MSRDPAQERERVKRMIHVARLYHYAGQDQEQIAKVLGTSRSTISRLLKEAHNSGIVELVIHDPLGYCTNLEGEMVRTFGLKRAIIIPFHPTATEEEIKRDIGRVGAGFLRQVVSDEDVIGVSWGTTLLCVADAIKPKYLSNATVVQLNGVFGQVELSRIANRIIERIAHAFSARSYVLPAPTIVDTPELKAALMADRNIKAILDLGRRCNVAIFSMGVPGSNSLLVKAGYVTPEEMEEIVKAGAAADFCAHYVDANGNLMEKLNERSIGVDVTTLRDKRESIVVAGGMHKARAILAVLRGGYATTLITDEATARAVLKQEREGVVSR